MGCTSSVFTGDKSNDQKPTSGAFNKACFNLNLSSETLDAKTARSLLGCMNSNGSIQAYADLVAELDDPQLNGLLDIVNQELLLDKRRLKNLSRSFDQMDQRGILDLAFQKVGQILSNGRFVSSGLKLLRQGATLDNGKLKPELLSIIEVAAQELSTGKGARANLNTGLEMGMRATSLNSYRELVSGLRPAIAIGRPGLRALSARTLEYLQEKIRAPQPLGKILLWSIADGSFPAVLDHYNKERAENGSLLSVDHQVQAIEHFLHFLMVAHRDDLFAKMVNLFQTMDAPIDCMDGTKQIPNADMYVMNEFISKDPLQVPFWTVRSNLLKMKVASGMCDLPSNFNDLMAVLKTLADSKDVDDDGAEIDRRPLVTITHFVAALAHGDALPMDAEAYADLAPTMPYPANERFRRFLISFLGDKGDVNAYTHLADGLSELLLKERRVVPNLFYMLNAAAPVGSKDRENLQHVVRVLMTKREKLESRSIYDVLSERVLSATADVFFDVLDSASTFVGSDTEYVAPLLSVSREGLLLNDVNPIVEMTLNVAKNVKAYEPALNTAFAFVSNDTLRTKLEAALQLTSEMAANGNLKELLRGTLGLFKRSIDRLPGEPALVSIPTAIPVDATLDKSVRRQDPWIRNAVYWPHEADGSEVATVADCKDMDLNFGLQQTKDSRWSDEFLRMSSCVTSTRDNDCHSEYGEFSGFSRYVLDGERPVDPVTKQTLGAFLVDLSADLLRIPDAAKKKKAYDEFSDLLLDSNDFRDMRDFQDVLQFTVTNQYCSSNAPDCDDGAEKISLLQGVARVFGKLTGEGARLQKLMNLGASIVSDTKMPVSTALIYDLLGDAEKLPAPTEVLRPSLFSGEKGSPYPLDLKQRVEKLLVKHGVKPQDLPAQLGQIEHDYFNQVRNGEKIYGYKTPEDFKKAFRPLFDALSDDSKANPNAPAGTCENGRTMECLFTFFRRLDMNPYDPEWYDGWHRRLAQNVFPIEYYYPGTYPGKDKPQVRVVSQLDMLELIVIEGDFSLRELKQFEGIAFLDLDTNMAVKALATLAMQGEDMRDWYEDIDLDLKLFESVVFHPVLGLPMKKELKRRLFNLRQVYRVLPDTDKQVQIIRDHRTGAKLVRSDLGVLRDLFKAVMSATPASKWRNYKRSENTIAFIADFVKAGGLRLPGLNMWYRGEDGKAKPTRIAQIIKLLGTAAYIKQASGEYRLNPDLIETLDYVLRKDRARTDVPANKLSFDERYVLLGRLVDQVYAWTAQDDERAQKGETRVMALIKNAGYNLANLIERQEVAGQAQGVDVLRTVIRVLKPLLATQKGAKLLAENLDLLDDVLTKPKAANFLKLVLDAPKNTAPVGDRNYVEADAYLDFLELGNTSIEKLARNNSELTQDTVHLLYTLYMDPEKQLKKTNEANKNLGDDPQYIAFKHATKDRVMERVVHWLVNPDGSKVLPWRLQQYLAAHMINGDLVKLIQHIGNQTYEPGAGNRFLAALPFFGGRPILTDRFYNNIRFLGYNHYVSGLKDFMETMRSGLVDTYPPAPIAIGQN